MDDNPRSEPVLPTTPSLTITVDFEHWRVELQEDWLIQFGSPHFEPPRARAELFRRCVDHGSQVGPDLRLAFPRTQILLANEVFPEAAVADPLADLEVWDEWNSGIRAFPYPGQYSRLGLVTQESKTSASSSVGVLGEIMAGLFAQAGISPWVLVRVVRRWPDFIFYSPHEDRYSFVEAKAFTTELPRYSGLSGRVHEGLLGECAHQAVQQINADPWVKVWGAFTAIRSLSPFHLSVTFVEFDCGANRRTPGTRRLIPRAVITGIAGQALVLGAQNLSDDDYAALRHRQGRRREDAQHHLRQGARRHVEDLLLKAGPAVAVSNSRADVEQEIDRLASSATTADEHEGKQFFEARRAAVKGEAAPIRVLGEGVIQTKDLSREDLERFDHEWERDWRAATWSPDVDGVRGWRFGGSLYWLASPPTIASSPPEHSDPSPQ